MKDKIKNCIEKNLDQLFDIAKILYENPEISEEEKISSEILVKYLRTKGFNVENPYLGEEYGFRAEYGGKREGLNIGFFCEYDALPEIGHGCGHNLICTASIAAGVALKATIDEFGGKITLFGTPAEESNGVKGIYGEKGAYKNINIALMTHPNGVSVASGTSLAMKAIEYEYFGRTAHAATAPEEGINALDAVILLFNGINAIRQHVKSDVRIHGIIANGGVAANIVPDYASARFYIRAEKKAYLNQVEEKMIQIAKGAANMTGARLETNYYELPYDDMVTNEVLSEAFNRNLQEVTGETVEISGMSGSMDMGNVSHYVPAIHPMVGLGDKELVCHTKAFAEATATEKGREYIKNASFSLALTALEIIKNPKLYERIREEFERNIN